MCGDDRLGAHLGVDDTLAVDFVAVNVELTHTQFGAPEVKDAIVDQFRERTGVRPSVDQSRPDVRVNVYVHARRGDAERRPVRREPAPARLSRPRQVAAPLKENARGGHPAARRLAGDRREGGASWTRCAGRERCRSKRR